MDSGNCCSQGNYLLGRLTPEQQLLSETERSSLGLGHILYREWIAACAEEAGLDPSDETLYAYGN